MLLIFRKRWLWVLTVGVLVLATCGWRDRAAQLSLVVPLPQDPNIQVYFNHSQAQIYTDPYRHIQRYGDDLEQVIIDAIADAESSVEVAVQAINLPKIAQALSDRARAGVTVRVIVENQYNRVWRPANLSLGQAVKQRQQAQQQEQQRLIDRNGDGKISAREVAQGDAIRILQTAAIPLLDDTADGSKGSGLMHHKFMIVDGKTLIVGSANWTLSGIHGDFAHPESRGNANAVLRIRSAELAAVFRQEFDLMWGDGPKGKEDSRFGVQKPPRSPQTIKISGTPITVQFSPTSKSEDWRLSVNGLIGQTLARVSQRINLALFVFSDQGISDRLAMRSQAGIAVQALVDASFIYRSYSEALDMLGIATPDHRCRFEANNRPWRQPIQQVGTPRLPQGDKLHHKFAILDDHTVIIGSHNWSTSANHNNDEDLLIIRNSTVTAHFQREFDRLMALAETGLTQELSDRLQRQRKRCGFS